MIHHSKESLRERFKKVRSEIPKYRREWARVDLKTTLKNNFSKYGLTLSYSSFNSELETDLANEYLLKKGKLALPKVINDEIEVFQVYCLKSQLKISSFGMMEPDENLCKKIAIENVQLALIAGTCFDSSFHRVGYGKGHYDKLLSRLGCPIIGIGYKEQYFSERIPVEPHDKQLDCLSLF